MKKLLENRKGKTLVEIIVVVFLMVTLCFFFCKININFSNGKNEIVEIINNVNYVKNLNSKGFKGAKLIFYRKKSKRGFENFYDFVDGKVSERVFLKKITVENIKDREKNSKIIVRFNENLTNKGGTITLKLNNERFYLAISPITGNVALKVDKK